MNEVFSYKPFYIYKIPETLLSTLTVEEDKKVFLPENESESSIYDINKEMLFTCSTCKEIQFNSTEEHRIHVKTDWHKFNLKRKAKEMPLLDYKEFEEALEEIEESISGTDSESEDSVLDDMEGLFVSNTKKFIEEKTIESKKTKDPIIWTTSTILKKSTHIGFYRSLFDYDGSQAFISVLRENQLNTKNKNRTIALIMVGGGNFAGMIVSLYPKTENDKNYFKMDELNILHHKTFHRYTTRRKQGGSQSAHDSGKGAAISAGSSLRRYNEAALQTEIRQLLTSWKHALDESELIFVRASGKLSHKILFGYENSVLSMTDKRLKKIPFTTRRATRNELIRCFNELTMAKIVEIDTEEIEVIPETQITNVTSIFKTIEVNKEMEIQKKNTLQIILLVKKGNPQKLIDYIEKNSLSYDFQFQPISLYQHTSTPLHLSSSLSLSFIVIALLEKGANPTIRNGNGKTPYDIAGNKTTRYAFRLSRANLGEEKWDWGLAHVASPLTQNEIKKREAQSKELKIKSLQEKQRQKEELKKHIETNPPKIIDTEATKKKPIISLSLEKKLQDQRNLSPDIQKRIEREKRARAAEERIRKSKLLG
ncbi:hypothetical protein T552_03244 [Pneumocystis carinii B80]|uniref:VLRF1 domain-containing protein n=1 Tax=Pneumocystis carinii (strain B80) TaxID=1408658 RepID=A0A0W4ZC28_PNEC8|nr:hypothetical protein T552_03244 [Pneumocystis carinii B80]KTW25970.1 hypothetical protein T552_03244 [Pneumocystis carinii B80]